MTLMSNDDSLYERTEPQISEEELVRRETSSQSYSFEEVMDYLESLRRSHPI